MENRKLINVIKYVFVGIIFFTIPVFLYAYSPETTHRGLTQEMVKFYKSKYPEKISKNDEINIMQGSVDEDSPGTRALNHFYDPINNKAMKGGVTSKIWAQSTEKQASLSKSQAGLFNLLRDYFSFGSDFSWDRAIYEYVYGDRQRAMKSLGHILHLIEDASVPAHTRNDAHPPILDSVFHQRSIYENWAKKFSLSTIDIASKLEGQEEIKLNSLDEYFDSIANYSNNNFFSRNTINNDIFIEPVINKNEKEILLSDGKSYRFLYKDNYLLVKIKREFNFAILDFEDLYSLKDYDDLILNDYWNLLSKQAVLHGAGVIELFFKEVKKEKQTFALYNKNKSLIVKVVENIKDEAIDIFDGVKSFASNMNSKLSASFISIFPNNTQNNVKNNVLLEVNKNQKEDSKIINEKIIDVVVESAKDAKQSAPKVDFDVLVPEALPLTQETTQTKVVEDDVKVGDESVLVENDEVEVVTKDEVVESEYDIVEVPANFLGGVNVVPVFSGGSASASAGLVIEVEKQKEDPMGDVLAEDTASSTKNIINEIASSTESVLAGEIASSTEDVLDKIASSTKKILVLGDPFLILSSYDVSKKKVVLSFGAEFENASSTESIVYDLQYKTNFQEDWQDIEDQTSSTTVEFLTTGDDVKYIFRVKAKNIENKIESNWALMQFLSYKVPVVINEIAWMGTSADSSDEWIELYNKMDYEINLSGWTLKNSKNFSIELTGVIEPKGYYLLERTASTTTDIKENQLYTGAMNNIGLGSDLFLRDNKGDLIDFTNKWHAGDNSEKRTMERVSVYSEGDDALNWLDFSGDVFAKDASENEILGTPGRKNSVSGLYTHIGKNIEKDTFWSKEASPYYINYGIAIQKGVTLIIEPGVTVKFGGVKSNQNTESFLLVNGILDAKGVENEDIIFTSFFDDEADGVNSDQLENREPVFGDWRGIVFENTGEESVLKNIQIKYGGAAKRFQMSFVSEGALSVFSSSPKIENCVIDNSSRYGIYIKDGSNPKIANCSIKNTDASYINNKAQNGYGIYIKDASSTAEILDSIFENNNKGIVSKSASSTPLIIKNNIFSGNERNIDIYSNSFNIKIKNNKDENKEDGIYIAGAIASSTKAIFSKNDMSYIVESSITIQKGGELEIDPGVVIKSSRNRNYQDSLVTPIIVYGTLSAKGTKEEKIIFTYISDDEVDGYNSDKQDVETKSGMWRNIKIFGEEASNSVLENVIIRYGGASNRYSSDDYKGSLYIKNSSPKILNCRIEESKAFGINIEENSYPEISGCEIKNTEPNVYSNREFNGYGIYAGDQKSSSVISENNFSGNIIDIYLKTATTSEFKIEKNNFEGDKDNIFIRGNIGSRLTILDNDFDEKSRVRILANIDDDFVFEKDIPYVIDWLSVGENAKLTIASGVTLSMMQNAVFVINGEIEAVGTKENKIYFTALSTPNTEENGYRAGLWGALNITEKSKIAVFDNVVFSYGGNFSLQGSFQSAVIFARGGSIEMSNTVFEENTGGIVALDDGEVVILNSEFKNISNESLYTQGESKITISNSNIYPSIISKYTVRGGGSLPISAKNNWWGEESGPFNNALNLDGKGAEIAGNISFILWSAQKF